MQASSLLSINQSISHEGHLTIFDWDDTLCPSTWLKQSGVLLSPVTQTTALIFNQTESHVLQVLQVAQALGPVYIITAAELRWVQQICALYFPRLALLFSTTPAPNRISVLSARDYWAATQVQVPGTPTGWKFHSLEQVFMAEATQRPIQSLISIGDSEAEHAACREVVAKYSRNSKTLKFIREPSLEELHSQLAVTIQTLSEIGLQQGTFDLILARTGSTGSPFHAYYRQPASSSSSSPPRA